MAGFPVNVFELGEAYDASTIHKCICTLRDHIGIDIKRFKGCAMFSAVKITIHPESDSRLDIAYRARNFSLSL
jgi:hypothetical protein